MRDGEPRSRRATLFRAAAGLPTVALLAAPVLAVALLAAGLGVAAEPPKSKAKPKASPSPPVAAAAAGSTSAALRFDPKAPDNTSMETTVRLDVLTKDVTFEVPPAYQEGFAFWSGRMKGQKRSELYQFITLTGDRAGDGTVPFHRNVPKFQIDLEKDGKPLAPMMGPLEKVSSLAWDGTLDPFGNVRTLRLAAGEETEEMRELARAYVETAFPRVDGPRNLKIGDWVSVTEPLPLPSRMHIEGLQEIGLLITRDLVLKSHDGRIAAFDVRIRYAGDPARSSKDPMTTCVISGTGKGEVTFDARRGLFLATRQEGTLIFDIEAPLRPLADRPDTETPGSGKSHLEVVLTLNANQISNRVVGSEEN